MLVSLAEEERMLIAQNPDDCNLLAWARQLKHVRAWRDALTAELHDPILDQADLAAAESPASEAAPPPVALALGPVSGGCVDDAA